MTKLQSSYVFIVKLSTDIKNLIWSCYLLLSTLESCAIDRALNSKRVCKKKHWNRPFFIEKINFMIRLHWNGINFTTYHIEVAITFRSNVRFQWFKAQKASTLCAQLTRAISDKNKDVSVEILTKLWSS